jgi:rubredoxin
MGMSKSLNEEMKRKIAEMYNTSNMSMGSVAETLKVSKRSVQRYKDYDIIAKPISQTGQTLEEPEKPNQGNQNQIADTTAEPDNIDYETETTPNEGIIPMVTKVRKLESCPECGTPKSDWVRLDELDEDDPQPTREELLKYDCICPKCHELISEHVCPECGTPKSEWIPIDQVDEATDEEKRLYDYACPKCGELIKI